MEYVSSDSEIHERDEMKTNALLTSYKTYEIHRNKEILLQPKFC